MTYRDFFKAATGRAPFRFQERFRNENSRWTILKAPTGLGKTDTALVSWLHRRATEPDKTARRLIWCLPGRALSEQIAKRAEELVALSREDTRVLRLLGGSRDNELSLMPDQAAILIGTQDLLLSRALNRGYARSPFRWPIDFALFNNDCEWVLDEVQLLGDGLATSTQLAAFREKFGSFGAARTTWMSATFDTNWLKTVDFEPMVGKIHVVETEPADYEDPGNGAIVRKRVFSEKAVASAPIECRTPRGAAEFVAGNHQAGTLTLVITNTVARATEIRAAMMGKVTADVRLLHSRFRASDRQHHVNLALGAIPAEGRIIIATQVIEAGIDLDAALMVTDVAPWASMVQRFGRVNRYGERAGCRIFWVDRPLRTKRAPWASVTELKPKEIEEIAAPYNPDQIGESSRILAGLNSGAPADLPTAGGSPPWKNVLRRSDLLDLFDTSADLGGNQLDISRFVRSDEDRDVYVAWRTWDGFELPADLIEDGELCPVAFGEFESQRFEPGQVWFWNAGRSAWEHPETRYPGMVLLLHSSTGKYTTDLGWAPESKTPVPEAERGKGVEEAMDREPNSFLTYRQLLEDHTRDVCREMERLLNALQETGVEPHRDALLRAALLHDWGKAHRVMQETLHKTAGAYNGTEILAKQKRGDAWPRHSRRFFRHELASALVMLDAGETDLAAYLAAAHHGRVRVMVRSMPGEQNGGVDFIRGLKDGDRLLPCKLHDGADRPEVSLKLALARIGNGEMGASWTRRVLQLRDRLGPFRLAYLEALLRMADERASQGAGRPMEATA